MLKKDKLKNLIEPHFTKDLNKNSYYTKTIKANKLLTHTRFDLAFKLLYLEMLQKDVGFAKEIYKQHINAFTLGKFTEPGNENKNSFEKYIEEFQKTFEDIKTHGFDINRTLIPLSKNGSIANGAHRVASAIFLDKNVECVEIDTPDHIYDYKFFYNRNISTDILDIVATKFIEYSQNTYVAFIWPTAHGQDMEVEKTIPRIVYRKEISLTPNGAHNLLSQVYEGEAWLGSIENDFKGSKNKLVECFKSFDPVRVIVFQADNLDEVIKIKEKVRNIFKVGKHSIHITDTKEEAIRTARVVLNDNGIHFLNYAKPNKYISTYTKIAKFKDFITQNKLSPDMVVLDSGMVLSIYGLRESSDIDYLADHDKELAHVDKELECHDEELEYHMIKKSELIYNPQNYFYFRGLKFISFAQLYKMKKKRAGQKDINDCRMMEALIENFWLKAVVSKLKQKYFYFKVFTRQKLIHILKMLGIFEAIKRLMKGNR